MAKKASKRSEMTTRSSGNGSRPEVVVATSTEPARTRPRRSGSPAAKRRGQRRRQSNRPRATASSLSPTSMAALVPIGVRALSAVRTPRLPAILLGAGLTWLLMEKSGVSSGPAVRRARKALGDWGESFGETVSETAESTRHTLRQAAGSVKNSVGSAAGTVGKGLSGAGRKAQSGAEAVGQTIKDGAVSIGHTAERAREAFSDGWRNHPLAVCAAALAAGVATGMLMPSTRQESRLLGSTPKKALRGARKQGRSLVQRGKQFAEETLAATGREVRRQGLSPDALGRKLKRVASRVKASSTVH